MPGHLSRAFLDRSNYSVVILVLLLSDEIIIVREYKMAYRERIKLISQLEKERKSKVITYITSTRANLETQMFMDATRRVYEHLRELFKGRASDEMPIDLFIQSNGGDGTVPWRLVTLIREYTKKFRVIVPYRAFSAATLTALGADEILMHPMAMLGPTDATITSQFNPKDAQNNFIGISVEDVTAYIALIKDDVGIHHEDEIVQAFNMLPTQVHPLALGKVKRTLSQSRMMARKLLALHMDPRAEEHNIDEIVDNLTSKLFYHGHPINRVEAREHIGLNTVAFPNKRLERLIWNLYEDYEEEMMLDKPYAPVSEFLEEFPNPVPNQWAIGNTKSIPIVFVESSVRCDYSEYMYAVSGTRLPNHSVQVQPLSFGVTWKRGNTNPKKPAKPVKPAVAVPAPSAAVPSPVVVTPGQPPSSVPISQPADGSSNPSEVPSYAPGGVKPATAQRKRRVRRKKET